MFVGVLILPVKTMKCVFFMFNDNLFASSHSAISLDGLFNTLFMITSKKIPNLQYIPRNVHTVFALLCFVVVIHWLIFPFPSGLLHWHCGNLVIAKVPAKQPWWIWINNSFEFIMNDYITTTKQSTTKPCAYFLGYTASPYGRRTQSPLSYPHKGAAKW